MKRSRKILLFGLLGSILYMILCIYINEKEFINKSSPPIEQESNTSPIEFVDALLDKNSSNIKNNSTLDYKIENGVITIAGNMPTLSDNDMLRKSMMRFCGEDYCDRTIVFSDEKNTPPWKGFAIKVINLFYEENLTNASFSADENGNITLGGELLTKSSKDKITKLLQLNGDKSIIDNTHLRISQISVDSDINDTNSTNTTTSVESNITISDELTIAQNKISKLLIDRKINFYRNRAKITPKGITTLNEIADILKNIPDVNIEVRGYTDASGERDINKWISQERAKSVKRYLESRGLNPINIKAEGFGEDNLLHKDEPNSPLNRRVEIEIKRKQ